MPYFTTLDGCRLYYETHGFTSSKPVAVFLNGTMQNTVYWRPHARSLKEHFRAILYDARAQGQSDLGQGQLSLEAHAADLSQLLNHVGVEKAHLVGMSHGAKVALAFAAQAPEHVARMVLCSVGAAWTCRARLMVGSWLQILQSSGLETMVWASLPFFFGEGFLKQRERILNSVVKAVVTRNSREALVRQFEAMTAYPSLSQIAPNVHSPCLIVSASDDPFVTEEGAGQLAELCHGRHKHIVGIGHSIPAETPEWFNKMLLKFLSAYA